MFPVAEKNRAYGNKDLALGIELGGVSKAYPFEELAACGARSFDDDIGGETVTVEWYEEDEFARVLDEQGDELPSVIAFWFAWYAFNPDTEIYRARNQ